MTITLNPKLRTKRQKERALAKEKKAQTKAVYPAIPAGLIAERIKSLNVSLHARCAKPFPNGGVRYLVHVIDNQTGDFVIMAAQDTLEEAVLKAVERAERCIPQHKGA